MDATRPHDLGHGKLGRRFYIVCEAKRSFRAISAGHGGGRDLKGAADFKNGRRCAKNFGNALDSKLTAGGAYVTDEIKTSFKGYYHLSAKRRAAFMRSFVQFDGEGETANARQRAIGGHAAALLRKVCRLKDPHSPHANHDGYIRLGKLVDYANGRSNGCTSWSRPDAKKIVALVKDDPTTLYIYPEKADIDAVAQAVEAGRPPRALLGRVLLEQNPRAEILAEQNARADHRAIQEGSSAGAGAAAADLQGAVILACFGMPPDCRLAGSSG